MNPLSERRFVVSELSPNQFAIRVAADGGAVVEIAPRVSNEAAAWRLAELLEREADRVVVFPATDASV